MTSPDLRTMDLSSHLSLESPRRGTSCDAAFVVLHAVVVVLAMADSTGPTWSPRDMERKRVAGSHDPATYNPPGAGRVAVNARRVPSGLPRDPPHHPRRPRQIPAGSPCDAPVHPGN